jgi:hypothetical protein
MRDRSLLLIKVYRRSTQIGALKAMVRNMAMMRVKDDDAMDDSLIVHYYLRRVLYCIFCLPPACPHTYPLVVSPSVLYDESLSSWALIPPSSPQDAARF